jgi:hypothetical protein
MAYVGNRYGQMLANRLHITPGRLSELTAKSDYDSHREQRKRSFLPKIDLTRHLQQ